MQGKNDRVCVRLRHPSITHCCNGYDIAPNHACCFLFHFELSWNSWAYIKHVDSAPSPGILLLQVCKKKNNKIVCEIKAIRNFIPTSRTGLSRSVCTPSKWCARAAGDSKDQNTSKWCKMTCARHKQAGWFTVKVVQSPEWTMYVCLFTPLHLHDLHVEFQAQNPSRMRPLTDCMNV